MLSASQSGPKPKQNPNVKISTTNMIHSFIHKQHLFSTTPGTVGAPTTLQPQGRKALLEKYKKQCPIAPTNLITKILMAWKIEVGPHLLQPLTRLGQSRLYDSFDPMTDRWEHWYPPREMQHRYMAAWGEAELTSGQRGALEGEPFSAVWPWPTKESRIWEKWDTTGKPLEEWRRTERWEEVLQMKGILPHPKSGQELRTSFHPRSTEKVKHKLELKERGLKLSEG